MGRTGTIGALALVLLAPQVVQAQPLQANEIELHIEATGQVAPDRAEVDFNLRGRAETKAEANRQLEAGIAELRAKLKDLGIRADQTSVAYSTTNYPMIEAVSVPPPVIVPAPVPAAVTTVQVTPPPQPDRPTPPKPRPSAWSNATMTVKLADTALLSRVMALRSENDAWSLSRTPRLSTSDLVAAEQKAVERAFVDARAKADAYAAVMGYKVVRIIRVSNARPALNLPDAVRTFAAMEGPAGRDRSALQATTASVAIDFAIAPK